MKLHQIVYHFLENLKYRVKKRTYLHYQSLYNIYISKHFDIDLKTLTNNHLNVILSQLLKKYSNSLIKALKSLLNRALTFAYESKMIKKTFAITLKILHKSEKKVECLTKDEQLKLEKHILNNKKYYSYGVLFSIYTGLRLGELLALKWSDIDFKTKILKVTKSTSKCLENHKLIEITDSPKTHSSIREIPLTTELTKMLKELKAQNNSEYIVSNRKGGKMDYRTYQISFTKLLKRLNIKHYGFHSLRHTFATRLLENNVDIKTISELLGHSSPTITLNRYVHTNIENKRKAMSRLTKPHLFDNNADQM